MKFKAWGARRVIENNYKTALRKLGRFLTALISPDDTPEDIASKMDELTASDAMATWAGALAKKFVTHVLDENSRTWRQAASKEGHGKQIYNELQHELQGPVGTRVNELIDENAQYIKSLPADVALQMTKHMESEAYKGSRQAYTYPEFQAMVGDMSMKHAKMIARTETAKAMSALTQARAEQCGHDWYIWHTTENERVRESHQLMNHVLCRFSDPPAPEKLAGKKSAGHYNPGNIYNCRCYAAPVILWDEVEWPHKVCFCNTIKKLSKMQFIRYFGTGGE